MNKENQFEHFGERNITLDIGNREAYPYFERLGKALSSSVRVEILDLLRVKSMSVVEIANKLNIPVSSTAFHIKCLEQAGLVITKTQPGMRGSMRISLCCVKSILISTSMDDMFPETQSIVVDKELSFSLELCSEAPGYQDVWPSDISIYINEVHCFTYRSTGDFGSRRGKLTPPAWNYGSTQYGLLKTFSIRRNGAYLDEMLIDNSINIDSLHLADHAYISFKIGIEADAKTNGGINIFGEKYGDFPQNIIMRIDY